MTAFRRFIEGKEVLSSERLVVTFDIPDTVPPQQFDVLSISNSDSSGNIPEDPDVLAVHQKDLTNLRTAMKASDEPKGHEGEGQANITPAPLSPFAP